MNKDNRNDLIVTGVMVIIPIVLLTVAPKLVSVNETVLIMCTWILSMAISGITVIIYYRRNGVPKPTTFEPTKTILWVVFASFLGVFIGTFMI